MPATSDPASSPLLHAQTEKQLRAFIERPGHALLLTGTLGIGKSCVAIWLVRQLLANYAPSLENEPNLRIVLPDKPSSTSVEAIRGLQKFLELKVVGKGRRIVLIDDAELLTEQAQNALLKTLEEPTDKTIIILCSSNLMALLPTIRSRAQTIDIKRPTTEAVTAHFAAQGYTEAAIRKAQLIAGGLPGLLTALLAGYEDHPLSRAAATARQILQASTFDRLAMVDTLSKQKEDTLRVLNIMQQMAHVSLSLEATTPERQIIWRAILQASYRAAGQLRANAQAKLTLTNLMLEL